MGGRYELTRKQKLHVCASLFPVSLCVGVSPDHVHGWCLMGLHNTTLVLTAHYLTGFLSFLLLALCLCPCLGFCVYPSVSDSLGLLLPPFLTVSVSVCISIYFSASPFVSMSISAFCQFVFLSLFLSHFFLFFCVCMSFCFCLCL